MTRLLTTLGSILLLSLSAQGQSFSSGSTGADGPLDLSSGDRTVQLPESGVLNYTTVNIPAGRALKFAKNSRNTPVYMLAQGNVTIGGAINVSSGFDAGLDRRFPGPGGFYGGISGRSGFGPGGGQGGGPNCAAKWIGPLSLVPIVGGSGGGSGCQGDGGGGGGAIVIASSTSILISSGAGISANGDTGIGFGFGAAGAIRLVANSIVVNGGLSAVVPFASGSGNGVIRLEAPAGSLTFTGVSNPAAGLFPINPVVTQPTNPSLTIVSIGGLVVPASAGQRFDTYDMLLPNQLTDPISVVVQASNIPVGTQVTVGMVNGSPSATTTTSALQGTFASSTATPTISNLNRTVVTYLLASATFDPPQGSASFNQKGANHVEKVRVESLVGAKPKFVFLRKDGSVVNPERLLPQFIAEFGQ